MHVYYVCSHSWKMWDIIGFSPICAPQMSLMCSYLGICFQIQKGCFCAHVYFQFSHSDNRVMYVKGYLSLTLVFLLFAFTYHMDRVSKTKFTEITIDFFLERWPSPPLVVNGTFSVVSI